MWIKNDGRYDRIKSNAVILQTYGKPNESYDSIALIGWKSGLHDR